MYSIICDTIRIKEIPLGVEMGIKEKRKRKRMKIIIS